MPDRITITEADLRKAISNPLYRSDWDPDHRAYFGWVENGFRALNDAGVPKGGSVEVSAYERRRNGKIQQVGAHTRGAPERGGLETPAMGPALREGGKIFLPRIIGSLPGWAAHLPPLRRPSLLDPPEAGGRRRGTLGGAVQSVAPEEERSDQDGTPAGRRESPDTVEGLREASKSRGQDGRGADIWDAGGNEDQRDADLQALRPGPMRPEKGGMIGTLPDGRQVMIRPGGRFSDSEPTLEISKPDGVGRNGRPRFTVTDKFRYRRGRG